MSLRVTPMCDIANVQCRVCFSGTGMCLISERRLKTIRRFIAYLRQLPTNQNFVSRPSIPTFIHRLLPSLGGFFRYSLESFPRRANLRYCGTTCRVCLSTPRHS